MTHGFSTATDPEVLYANLVAALDRIDWLTKDREGSDERHKKIFDRDRETIRRYSEELVPKMRAKIDELEQAWDDQNRELEVLTTERDNALLRIEELEGEVAEYQSYQYHLKLERNLLDAVREVPDE